jgi:hypothetical protein
VNVNVTLWVIAGFAVGGTLLMLFGDNMLRRLVAGPKPKTNNVASKDDDDETPRMPRRTPDARTVVLGIIAVVVIAHIAVDAWSRRPRGAQQQRLDVIEDQVDDIDRRLRSIEGR